MGDPSRVRVTGPLTAYAAGFAADLTRVGYRKNPTVDQVRLLAHLSRWLATEGLGVEQVTPAVCDAFLVARRGEGYTLWLSPKALVPLLAYLRGLGVLPPEPVGGAGPVDAMLQRYRGYLTSERGLAASTAEVYVRLMRPFLRRHESASGTLDLYGLTAGDITTYVVADVAGRGSAKPAITALRSLLAFLHLEGHLGRSLATAVPSVAGFRLSGLPRALDPDQVDRLLSSCDPGTALGRRDRAVLTVLARLGLRAGEVVALQLEDVDWRHGEIMVRGSGD